MTRRGVVAVAGAIIVVGLFAWALTASLERVMRPAAPPTSSSPDASEQRAAPVRHITATLFLATNNAERLVPVQREVPFGEGPIEQGRQIVLAQLNAPAEGSLVSAIPPGSTLRGFYISERGAAFVDLGPEIVSAHPGGSAAEQLTVYTIVNAVVVNLPAVTSVQLLVNGKEVDTLAGHIDIRRTLRRNDVIVKDSN